MLLSDVSGAQFLLYSLLSLFIFLYLSIREKNSIIINFEKVFKKHELKVNGLLHFSEIFCADINIYTHFTLLRLHSA